MKFEHDYFDTQVDAIEEFYTTLSQDPGGNISMTEAIVKWFTEGPAEDFREMHLEEPAAVV